MKAISLGLFVHVCPLFRLFLHSCTKPPDDNVYYQARCHTPIDASESRREALGVTREHAGLPYVVQPTEEHHNTLHSHPQAPVWWSSILEAVEIRLDALQRDLMCFGPLCIGMPICQYTPSCGPSPCCSVP